MMNIRQLITSLSLVVGSAIALSAPAQAFSFKTNYTSTLSGGDAAKGDLLLDSVTFDSGKIISDFVLVNSVNIISNDVYTGGNSGAASADTGDLATTGTVLEDLTSAAATENLSNLNLSNIIDTEDQGSFVLDLNFEAAVNNLFLWERGMNSRLDVQALDASGNVIGNKIALSNSRTWDYAGFDLDTTEIYGAQKVGSIGVSLADLGISNPFSSLRLSSDSQAYNGPDFKVIGSIAAPREVPEPSALIGLGAVVAGVLATRRRKQQAA